MKKLLFIMLLLGVCVMRAQTYQQTEIELDSEIPKDKSFVYEASTSIKMLKGFHCQPKGKNSVMFAIDRFGVFPPEEGITGGASALSQDGVVGALPGELNVGNLGAAEYSVPILLPQGIGNMTPEIAVIYNNQAGNGLLGWAWDLSGLSSIVRVGQTLYHDGNRTAVNFTDDRFMMDGKRLMLCSGNAQGNGAIFKTEVDEMSKITAYSDGYIGPERFIVRKKDGTTWEYGCTDDSRVEAQNKNNVVLKWLVNKIIDPDGNYISFNYIENHNTGESYINRIDYTLNDIAGIQTMYQVVFSYDDREDYEEGYVYGSLVQKKKLLRNIIVRNMQTGTVLYDYSFDYFAPGNYSSDMKFLYHRLKNIRMSAGDMKLNPTAISWNKNSHYNDKFLSYSLNQNVFNKVPFVGDFNGDGYSDVMLVPHKQSNTYSTSVQATIVINKGDGTFNDEAFYTFSFDRTLEWIYVIDFDGDGLDDVVPYYANQEENSNWKSKFCVYLNRGSSFAYLGDFVAERYFTLYPGDFFGNRKVGLLLNYNNINQSNDYFPNVFYYGSNNSMIMQTQQEMSLGIPEHVLIEDFDGDGSSEIMYLMESCAFIIKLDLDNDNVDFLRLYIDTNFDSGDFLFPGDFNGDGYTDLLKYDDLNYWNIAIFDGDRFKAPVPCLNNNLLRGLTLAPQDRYLCSLQNLSMPSETIRTADFDGDGKADVGVFKNTGGNYYLEIGFKPYEKSSNNIDFTYIRRFNLIINHSHQYVHMGNFLGHENVSILSNVKTNPGSYEVPKIVSLNPHSSKFSVERITDGLGNSRGLKYEYLMPKDGFYDYEYQWVDSKSRTVALPVKALCADTVFSTNSKTVVTKYSYKNMVYHTEGHGLLGFLQTDSKVLVDNALSQSDTFVSELESMGDNYIMLPQSHIKYNCYNQIVLKEMNAYKKYVNVNNDKVIMPLMASKKTINYDVDTPGSILKSNITNVDYQSDVSNYTYSDVVNVSKTIDGTDDNYIGDDATACSFWSETDYTYNNNPSKWIVERLQSIKKSMHYADNESVGSCEIYDYSGNSSYQITRKTSLPNAEMNYADPLKIVSDYSYDAVGHVVMQSLISPSAKNQRVKRMNYGEEYNYRYPTSMINENGWEVDVAYNNDYGDLRSMIDYNGFTTESDSDPFEITVEKNMPDGTKSVDAKRWAQGNKYAPQDAIYYIWTKTTGNAENLTFFSKTGKKLREVTFGLNGEAIYVDMTYDNYENMSSKSMPYIVGDEPKYCHYVYDKNNRLIEEVYPNGLVKNYSYNKLQRMISTVSPEGVSRDVTETENPMGWRIQTIDVGGNNINYDYYSDGKLKSSMIGDDAQTKVEYEYDGRRNLLRMRDPACGEILYSYNAYGELTEQTNAKNCVTMYIYDNMGNILERLESDEQGQDPVITQWIYDQSKGKIGMLSGILYGDSHSVTYNYDGLLRLVGVDEMIKGKNYTTLYAYDKANRAEVVIYPSGVAIQNQYSNSGYNKSIIKQSDDSVLWEAESANAMGYIIDYQYGNGVRTRRKYDHETNLLTGINSCSDKKIYQNLSYSYDGFGNLINRSSLSGNNLIESFTYDKFNRLVSVRLNNKLTGWMEYDEYGNILSKYFDYQNVFYDAQYSGVCPYAVTKVKTDLDESDDLNQEIEYTVFDKMRHVDCGKNSLSIDYGYDYDRKYSAESVDGFFREKVYVSDCEFVNDQGNNFVYTYLKCPMGVFAVSCINDKGEEDILYVHKDHLDSWCLITDEDGKVVQKTSYDAWGNPRNDDTWSGKYKGKLLCDRGFTGHEHLLAFGIINMNGRAYDPLLSMMMSPDSNIQNPDFSQNYNRYIYCYNNPLSYSDPSGEWVEWLLYGVFSGTVNVIFNIESIDSFQEGLLSFGAGFVCGCLAQGVSNCSWALQVVGNVAGTTLKYGVNSFVQQNTGSKLDWSILEDKEFKSDVMYALGSSLAKSVLTSYLVQPTDEDEGKTISNMLCHEKYNQRILETASKKIVGNLFSGRKVFDGFAITKKNLEDALPYLECVLDIVADNVEFQGHSETLSKISDKLLNFDFKGFMSKYGNDMNYCYSQFRSLFVKKGG